MILIAEVVDGDVRPVLGRCVAQSAGAADPFRSARRKAGQNDGGPQIRRGAIFGDKRPNSARSERQDATARFYVATIALMRLLTFTDLLLCLGLFAIGSFIACSGDPLWLFALPLIVGAAVGVLGGRLRTGLATGGSGTVSGLCQEKPFLFVWISPLLVPIENKRQPDKQRKKWNSETPISRRVLRLIDLVDEKRNFNDDGESDERPEDDLDNLHARHSTRQRMKKPLGCFSIGLDLLGWHREADLRECRSISLQTQPNEV